MLYDFERMMGSRYSICSFKIGADFITVDFVANPVDLGIVRFGRCRLIIKLKVVVPVYLSI